MPGDFAGQVKAQCMTGNYPQKTRIIFRKACLLQPSHMSEAIVRVLGLAPGLTHQQDGDNLILHFVLRCGQYEGDKALIGITEAGANFSLGPVA